MPKFHSFFFALALTLTSLSFAEQAAASEVSIPLSQIVENKPTTDDRSSWYGIDFKMPILWGTRMTGVHVDLVIGNMDATWSSISQKQIGIRYKDEDTSLGTQELSPDSFSYRTDFSRVPRRGSRLRLELADLGPFCNNLQDILSSIDLKASRLVVEIDDDNGIRLPIIEGMLGPDLGLNQTLHIWTPHGITSNADLLSSSLITQGWVLRAPDRSPIVDVRHLPTGGQESFPLLPGVDMNSIPAGPQVILGTADELTGFVSERILNEIKGPYVRVLVAPDKPFRLFIVVSGKTDLEVSTAARAVGTPYFSWPDGAGVLFKVGADVKQDVKTDLPGVIWGPNDKDDSAKLYAFDNLGIYTQTWNGEGKSIRIPVVVPEQLLNAKPDQMIELRLNSSYGPGFDPSSAWVVTLGEDRFIGVVPLNKASGDSVNETLVKIPVKLLHAGQDFITITPHFTPIGWNHCSRLDNHGLKATIFSSSSVTVPFIGGGAVSRTLANWTASGLLIPNSEEIKSTWVLASHGDDAASAALTLLAKQVTILKRPLVDVALTYDWDTKATNKVIIGTHSDVIGVLEGKPLQPGAVPFDHSQPKAEGWGKMVSDYTGAARLFGEDNDKRSRILDALRDLRLRSDDPSRVAAVFGYTERKNTIIGISAFDKESLRSDVDDIVLADRWNKIHGDITLYDPRTDEMITSSVVNPEQTVNPSDDLIGSLRNSIENLAGNNAAMWSLFGLGMMLIFALTVRFLLRSGGMSNRNRGNKKDKKGRDDDRTR